jgi:hypothetical protein
MSKSTMNWRKYDKQINKERRRSMNATPTRPNNKNQCKTVLYTSENNICTTKFYFSRTCFQAQYDSVMGFFSSSFWSNLHVSHVFIPEPPVTLKKYCFMFLDHYFHTLEQLSSRISRLINHDNNT